METWKDIPALEGGRLLAGYLSAVCTAGVTGVHSAEYAPRMIRNQPGASVLRPRAGTKSGEADGD